MATAEYTPGDLIVGDLGPVHRHVTIVSGQNLTRGAVLGRITATDKYALSASGAGDGSQTPKLVLAVDCDASAGDKVAPAFAIAEVAADKLTFGTGHDADTVEASFRQSDVSIFVRTRA